MRVIDDVFYSVKIARLFCKPETNVRIEADIYSRTEGEEEPWLVLPARQLHVPLSGVYIQLINKSITARWP